MHIQKYFNDFAERFSERCTTTPSSESSNDTSSSLVVMMATWWPLNTSCRASRCVATSVPPHRPGGYCQVRMATFNGTLSTLADTSQACAAHSGLL